MAIDRMKTSLYLDRELVQMAKMLAASSGKHEYEVIEAALRAYAAAQREAAGLRLMDTFDRIDEYQRSQGLEPLSEEEAKDLANEAKHSARQQEHG